MGVVVVEMTALVLLFTEEAMVVVRRFGGRWQLRWQLQK